MYYKLLNKTILTSALVSLICASVNKASAQELFNDDVDINIVLPAPEETSNNVQSDAIPLATDPLIVPEPAVQAQREEKVVLEIKPEENVVVEVKPEKIVSEKKADVFDISLDDQPVVTPEPKKEVAPKAPKKEVVPETKNEAKPTAVAPKAKQKEAKVTTKESSKKAEESKNLLSGDEVLARSNNDLFSQMSDLEKQTTLLTLELKREKIRNEVEAAKAVREKAEQDKLAKEKAKEREEAEWQKEQELKTIKAEEDLKQKEIELEKLKQRKALTAYMNSMLEQKQSWIDESSKLHDEIKSLKETNLTLRQAYKNNLEAVSMETEKVLKDAEEAKSNHERAVASLMAQNAQLKKRIEANELAAKKGAENPFAATEASKDVSTPADSLIKPVNVAKEYAIMEITGKGPDLRAKLINKEGDSFLAKVGTILQTGHMVEDITPTYIQFDRNGLKDFLYTSTTALTTEPDRLSSNEEKSSKQEEDAHPKVNLIGEEEVPSLGESMFVK